EVFHVRTQLNCLIFWPVPHGSSALNRGHERHRAPGVVVPLRDARGALGASSAEDDRLCRSAQPRAGRACGGAARLATRRAEAAPLLSFWFGRVWRVIDAVAWPGPRTLLQGLWIVAALVVLAAALDMLRVRVLPRRAFGPWGRA